MVGPHYTTAQRTFMAVEYAKNQGTRNFMEDLIGEFQVRFPGAIPPSRNTVYRQFKKLEHFHTLHNLNSKVIHNSSIDFFNASPFHRRVQGLLTVEDQGLQWPLLIQPMWEQYARVTLTKTLKSLTPLSAHRDGISWACQKAPGGAWSNRKSSIPSKWSDLTDFSLILSEVKSYSSKHCIRFQ